MKSLFRKIFCCIAVGLLAWPSFASNIPEYKVKTVHKIFNALKAAKGIFPHEEPTLVFEPVFTGGDNFVFAYIDYATSEIHLEELVYDVCVDELGRDSLNGIAFMLGHELAHFLKRHENVSHHVPKANHDLMGDKVFLDMLKGSIDGMDSTMLDAISISINQFQKREREASADLEGGFITYLAGYASDRTEPTLPSLFLEKVYDAIGAGSQMRGYPKLKERQAIASSTKAVLDSLIHLYEMGNALASIEHYEEAMTYFEILTRTFESREIYNNMGVNAFLDATKCFKTSILPKNIPITLDVDSRLEGGGKGGALNYDDLIRMRKLNTAIGYFNKAAQMDSEYPIALLNLSVTHLLKAIAYKLPFDSLSRDITAYKNELLLAKAAAVQAEMVAKEVLTKLDAFPEDLLKMKNILSNIYIQRASIAEEESNFSDLGNFKNLAKSIDPNNIFLAEVDTVTNVGNRTSVLCEKMESPLNGNSMLDLTRVLKDKWSTPVQVKFVQDRMNKEVQTFQRYEDSDILAYNHEANLNTGDNTLIMLVYPKTNVASVCGVKPGDTLEQLVEKYGKPVKYFPVTGGSYFVYDRVNQGSALHNGAVFFVGQNQKIKSWFSYLKLRRSS